MSKRFLIFSGFIAISVISVAMITPAQAIATASEPNRIIMRPWLIDILCIVKPDAQSCSHPADGPELDEAQPSELE